MARSSRTHLLGHLFAAVKAKQEGVDLTGDEAKAAFIAAGRMSVQAEVAGDPGKHVSVICPRRSGKSWLALSIALERCLRKPQSVWVILGLSRPTVEQIFWGLLKKMNLQMELGLTYREVALIATFPNGSQILFRGAETRSEIEKLRGGQYDGVVIDEAKSYDPVVFKELVEDIIEPALGDRKGVVYLIGTPGDQLAGPFYEATSWPAIEFEGDDGVKRFHCHLYGTPITLPYVWSLHTWTLKDNVECPWLWEEALSKKKLRGWTDDHPSWRREYLGKWVASKDRIVYRYQPHVHDYDLEDLPDEQQWVYVLGLDPGYKDSDAIVVWAYSRTDFHVYNVYNDKRAKQNITQLAGWLKEVIEDFCGETGPEEMVYDPAGGGAKIIAELADIHHLYFTEPAEKRDKNAYIELMNTEFDAGRLHIIRDSKYTIELIKNRWLAKTIGTEKRKEDPATPNDLCDAGLYAWRVCDHRRPVPPDRKLEDRSKEWWKAQKALEFLKAVNEHDKRKNHEEDFSKMDSDWWSRGGIWN